MISIITRTVLIYFFLLLAMRLVGKRQIGELEITELIVTFMLSELATVPIVERKVPLLHIIVPIMILLSLEVICSLIISRFPIMKRFMYGSPVVLICRGKILQNALTKNRMDISELMAELRLKDVADPSEVEYAILEDNGKLSVIRKAAVSPITPEFTNQNIREPGIAHPLIMRGKVSEAGLKMADKTLSWLESELRDAKVKAEEVFLMTVDDAGDVNIIKEDKKQEEN